MRKKLFFILTFSLFLISLVTFTRSRAQFNEGEKEFKQNQFVEAIAAYDASIHMYLPFNPYVEKSAARIWEIGEIAEKKNDKRLAILAYTRLRSSFYSTSWLFKPNDYWIIKSENKLSEIGAK